MASYEQVVKSENEKPQGVIRLVEANGFYRAYEHSAFLFHQVIAQHKVTRKFVKNINREVVYVGFPIDKLLERIGERKHRKTEFGYDVELASGELPDDAKSHYQSYSLRKVLLGKSRLGEFGRISEEGLRFYPNALDWQLFRLGLKGRMQ